MGGLDPFRVEDDVIGWLRARFPAKTKMSQELPISLF